MAMCPRNRPFLLIVMATVIMVTFLYVNLYMQPDGEDKNWINIFRFKNLAAFGPAHEIEAPNTDDITVVTAYFYIPKFQKGEGSQSFSNDTYFNWMSVFANLVNPLVVYTDSDEFYNLMGSLRKDRLNKTRLIKVDRNSFWAFQRESTVSEIFNQPGYPKHHPNTVIPAYSCAMHAKVEAMRRAAEDNTFHTNYFSWIDIGCFRDRVQDKSAFAIVKPHDFNKSRAAMSEVYTVNMKMNPEKIFLTNQVWVGGAVVLAHREILPVWEKQYRRAFEYFLSRKVMSTDQQILFAMFTYEGRKAIKPEVELQVYHGSWFSLGYMMRQTV